MRGLKRAIELIFLLVFFPLALLVAVEIAIAVSLTGLFAYLGGLLSAWLLFAYVFPLATGIMTPDEIVAGIRSQRRHHFEGESLPEDRGWWARWKSKRVEGKSLRDRKSLRAGESLAEDRALWFPWEPGKTDSLFS